jgi:hypothetical protein
MTYNQGNDSDVTLIVVQPKGISYQTTVLDPFFSATTPVVQEADTDEEDATCIDLTSPYQLSDPKCK